MRTHPLRPDLVLALACLLAILLFFFLGTAVPQAHLWAAYSCPLCLFSSGAGARHLHRHHSRQLTIGGIWTGGITTSGDFLANHLLPILILWTVASLSRAAPEKGRRRWMNRSETAPRGTGGERAAAGQALFRANPGAIAITRQSDGCYLDANPAYLQLLGYSKDELVGRRGVDLGHRVRLRAGADRRPLQSWGYRARRSRCS